MTLARRLFFATFTVTIAAEGSIGWYLTADIKSWAPIGIAFSIIELLMIVCVVLWLMRRESDRRAFAFERGRLYVPLLCFGGAIALGVLWGLVRGGDNLTYALFEVRAFGVMILAYFLVGMLIRNERDLSRLVWCVLIGTAALTLNNIYEYYFVFHGSRGLTDLSYDHIDSLMLTIGFVLCAGIVVFRGTRGQRRAALVLMPLIVFCLEIMHRRVAFAMLPVGLLMFAIVFYWLRPKVFWRVVPPLALMSILYVGMFWNNTGTLGQPARAIRSQISPDPRDASSDQYRVTEHADILQNIRSSRLTGLGFGQQYTFYFPLPDLSFWPFWHYTSHNAVLWVWMDGGLPAFFTFFWLMGAGAYAGSQELATRREAWSLAQLRVRRPKRQRSQRPATEPGPRSRLAGGTVRRAVAVAVPVAPPWMRPRGKAHSGKAVADGASLALLAVGLSMLVMQITFSYVDLGLTNTRSMLVAGVLLGVMGRTYVSGQPKPRRRLGAAPPEERAADGATSGAPLDSSGSQATALTRNLGGRAWGSSAAGRRGAPGTYPELTARARSGAHRGSRYLPTGSAGMASTRDPAELADSVFQQGTVTYR